MTEAPLISHEQLVVQSFSAQAERLNVASHLRAAEPIAWLLEALQLTGTETVLDVGCGSGLLTIALSRHCAEVWGVDLTSALLEHARRAAADQHVSNARFKLGDARELAWSDHAFDVVVSRLALHHVEDPARLLREVSRVLKPGGAVGIFDMTTSEDAAEAAVHNRFETYRDPSHARALPVSELLALMGAAGLEPQSVQTRLHEFELEDYIGRVDQPPESAVAVRRLAAEHLGTKSYLGRRLRQDAAGRTFYSHRWCVAVSTKS